MKVYRSLTRDYIILTLVSPLFSLYSLLKSGHSRLIVPVGTFLMAILGSVYVYLPGNDGHTHRMRVEENYLDITINEFFTIFSKLLIFSDNQVGLTDPYLHILASISGGLFGAPELLHVFSSLIYGLIYFSIIRILFTYINWPKGMSFILSLFILFFIYRGISGLNSIRWWTALWLMLYSFLAYWHFGKKKYLLLALLSAYVHFSFLAFLIPTIGALWLYKKPKLLLIIWVTSFFLGASYNMIKPYVPELDVIQKKERYTLNEEVIAIGNDKEDNSTKGNRFYQQFGESSFKDFSIPFIIIFIFLIGKYFFRKKNEVFVKMFAAGILLYSFGNVMEFSPAVHGRAQSGSAPFLLIALLLALSHAYKINKRLYNSYLTRFVIIVFLISCIPVVLFHLSYVMNILSAFAIVLPIVSWLLGSDDFSIRDLVANFLI